MRRRRIDLFRRKQHMAEPLVVNHWRTFIDSCHSRLFHQIDIATAAVPCNRFLGGVQSRAPAVGRLSPEGLVSQVRMRYLLRDETTT